MRTVSVIGASGFVGGRLYRYLRASATDFVTSGTAFSRREDPGLAQLDVTDGSQLERHVSAGFDFVIMAAGTKDVRRCEQDPSFAVRLNTTPVERMLEFVTRKSLPTRIVYLSTDYVFDGKRGGYRDDDRVAPATRYGWSKALAEQAVLGAGNGHRIVRSAAVMGRGGTFFDWLVRELSLAPEVPLFDDCFISPTPASLLAETLAELLMHFDEVRAPILHLVADRRMSRYELGTTVQRLLPASSTTIVRRPGVVPGTLLQRDLSMSPSDFVRRRPRATLEESLAAELAADR